MATNPAAHLDLWRFLLDIDLMAQIEAWNVAAGRPDPALRVAEPRRLGDRARRRALAAGGRRAVGACRAPLSATDGSIVLEVADEFCPWNDGRWALDVEDGVPARRAGNRLGRLACDVTDLARRLPRRLQLRAAGRAGRVRGARARAASRAPTPSSGPIARRGAPGSSDRSSRPRARARRRRRALVSARRVADADRR